MSAAQTDIIKVHRLGHTFHASRRTVAWLDFLIYHFKRTFPKARLVIYQTPYNKGVEASAGSHDWDAVFDFGFTGYIPGLTAGRKWRRFERFVRTHGGASWWRHTGHWKPRRRWHLHGFPLPVGITKFTTKVGYLVDGGLSIYGRIVSSSQLHDYTAIPMRDGLASHAKDDGYHPRNKKGQLDVKHTTFDYKTWTEKHGIPKGIK